MTFSTRSLMAAILAVLPFSAAAQTYEAPNLLKVVPTGATTFEVIEARGEGPRGLWCAAASYASDRLRAGAGTRLYVKDARGAARTVRGAKGVVFTTDPAQLDRAPSQALSVSVRTVGQGLPVNHAIQFCKDYIIEPEDILFLRKDRS